MSVQIEVHIDFQGGLKRVGLLRRIPKRDDEAVTFEYDDAWFNDPARFALEPALTVSRGVFAPDRGSAMFGSIGDSAPDTWGRRLMQRAERRNAAREGRAVATLLETDYLLGVSDVSRLGALRFKRPGDDEYQSPSRQGVPELVELSRLLQVTERILRDEETDEDLQLIFAPGSSLGGARPKASVVDAQGRLVIAKFPKETDDYSVELWEYVALTLAHQAGIRVPEHKLIRVARKPVLLSWRFDRDGAIRIPFLSALSMMRLKDGERTSYPELMEVLVAHGAHAAADTSELYRRMVFNVLVSNVDDHLRNHGFLWVGRNGWTLSPAYDLNPTPADVRQRILTTNISPDDGTCDIGLARSVAEYFGLSPSRADKIIHEVANATAKWREVAKQVGSTKREIDRLSSAFEHDDLRKALA
jgi:serine/threonine-protein kinase HipA